MVRGSHTKLLITARTCLGVTLCGSMGRFFPSAGESTSVGLDCILSWKFGAIAHFRTFAVWAEEHVDGLEVACTY